jgi:hypothetical protein
MHLRIISLKRLITFCMHHKKVNALCFLGFLFVSVTAYSQSVLHSMVADSATMLPLPNINVKIQSSGEIIVSDIRGHFAVNVTDNDTLIFSSVGYYTKAIPVKKIKEVGIIFMTEEQKMLKSIEIRGNVLLPYLKKIPPESAWQNPTQNKSFTETPGFQGIQTFGPGYVLKGPISRFSKYEKERKKLKTVQKQNYQARDYVAIVNDPEVKGRIMKDYNLTEEDYYKLLAVFNEKNKDIIYELQENELISILLMFYAENAKKK